MIIPMVLMQLGIFMDYCLETKKNYDERRERLRVQNLKK